MGSKKRGKAFSSPSTSSSTSNKNNDSSSSSSDSNSKNYEAIWSAPARPTAHALSLAAGSAEAFCEAMR